jgi:hypothetical protein
MANFPTSLDSYTANVDNVDIIYAADVNTLQEAVVALETKLGVNSSAVTTTHDYKLGEVTSTDKAVGKTATQTLTNKTLTSPVINVGSDATGDIYYRNAGALTRLPIGTDNHILKINGTVPNWEAETSTVNGSTTVAGIFEAATSAEVTAGTATGGTGAALAVTPDALAASTPVFSGLGVSNTVKLIRLAGYTAAANTTENTVFTTTITGGDLSTNGIIKTRTYVSFTVNANADTHTIRLKFGGSTLQTITVQAPAVATAVTSVGFIDAWIINNASASSQNVGFYISLAPQFGAGTTTNQTAYYATSPVDTTSAINTASSQTLLMTIQRSSGAGASPVFSQTLVETIKNA